MDTKNLYIFGGDYVDSSFKFKKNSKVIFFDNQQNIFENQYSVLSTFKENQDLLRDKWILFQDKVFQKIKPTMNNDQDYRYLLSNIFFEASPNKTKSIYQFFKILIIKEFIKKEKIQNIFLVNTSNEIKLFFNDNAKNLSLSVKIINLKEKKLNIFRKAKQIAKQNPITSIIASIINEIKKKKQKIDFKKKNEATKIVVSYYYPGGHSFDNGFKSNYFSDVSALINKKYNWLFLYQGNISKLNHENKLIADLSNSFGFLDSYFTLKDLLIVIKKFIFLRKKFKKINLQTLFIFEELNFSALMKNEWIISISYLLINLLIFEKKFSNFFLLNPKIDEVLYLKEFQPWEQMLNKVTNQFNIKTKGAIHAVVRPNVMNYYHSKNIHPFLYLPYMVGVNSTFSESLLLKNGYKNDQLIKIEAQRYNYLVKKQFKQNKIKKISNSILIITSMIPEETIELLTVFSKANLNFDKVYLKDHPVFPVRKLINSLLKGVSSVEILKESLSDALEYSDIIYTANGSSSLLEAVLKKKKTISLISLATLPTPSIKKAQNLYFVEDENSFKSKINLIKSINAKHNSDNSILSDLYLSNDLTLWQNFLTK